MDSRLTKQYIVELGTIDTPTVCNAIERFAARGRVEGFMGLHVRCLTPFVTPMVGYAVTARVDTTTPDVVRDDIVWMDWVRMMEASPKPVVLVFQDVGPLPHKSAHFGEMMGTLARQCGVVGLVTNGGVRDIEEIKRLGLHYFAAGLVPSHGNPCILDVNVPVTVDGIEIKPGDLIHGDQNGVTTIPWAIADRVVEAARDVQAAEKRLLDYINGPEFTVEGFLKRKFAH